MKSSARSQRLEGEEAVSGHSDKAPPHRNDLVRRFRAEQNHIARSKKERDLDWTIAAMAGIVLVTVLAVLH